MVGRISASLSAPPAPADPESNEDDNKKKKARGSLKAIKIRVYPTAKQRATLAKWFGACRATYNACAAAINDGLVEGTLTDKQFQMRTLYINKDSELAHFCPWVKEVPADLREDAMRDAVKAIVAYNAKKPDNKNGFKFRFRSKRDQQTLVVRHRHWNHESGVYSKIWGSCVLKTSSPKHPLPEKLPHDSRLVKDKMNRYFLCIPIGMDIKQRSEVPDKVVALDPGVRTFMTCYDQDGIVTEIAPGDRKRLFTLAIHASKLQSQRDALVKGKPHKPNPGKKKKKKRKRKRTPARKLKNKRMAKRNKMRKALLRANDNIRNLTDDVHKKACKWLLENHRVILLPAFQSSQMVKKEERKLAAKSVRSMMHWSHFRFRQRLLFKSQEYPGTHVLVVKEDYTSKTCGRCGAINNSLGASKTFRCPGCSFQCDRDVNGARNILLKWFTENPQHLPGRQGSLSPHSFQ